MVNARKDHHTVPTSLLRAAAVVGTYLHLCTRTVPIPTLRSAVPSIYFQKSFESVREDVADSSKKFRY